MTPQNLSRGLIRTPSPLYPAPALRLNTTEERESFDFFTSNAVSSLRGFLDSSFWQREILQAAYRNPSIQHCVIALGAMHRRFFEGNGSHINKAAFSDKYLQFALRQSNQAIQDLVRQQSTNGETVQTDRVTLMTCSVLFSSMCCLQGHQRDALKHLRSGVRMLNEMDEQKDAKIGNHPVDVESLRSIFIGLDMQARSIHSSAQSKKWVSKPKFKTSTLLPGTELNMASLLTMLRHLESLLNHIHAYFQDNVSRPPDEASDVCRGYNDLIIQFDRGAAVLQRLFEKARSHGDEFSQPLTLLQLLQCQIELLLRCPRVDFDVKFSITKNSKFAHHTSSKPFDSATKYLEMLKLAAKILPISPNAAPVFTMTMGPLSALWLIAMRAPSKFPALRRRAVKLMLSHPRREGFWDGILAGQIAQEVLSLEQESTQAEFGLSASLDRDLIVPDELRMIIVAISYAEDSDRRAQVAFSNSRDVAAGRSGAIRCIEW